MNVNVANARINTKAFISKLKQIIYFFTLNSKKIHRIFIFFQLTWISVMVKAARSSHRRSVTTAIIRAAARTYTRAHTCKQKPTSVRQDTRPADTQNHFAVRKSVSVCGMCVFFLLAPRLSQLLDAAGERVSVRSDHGGKNNPSLLQKAELTIVLFLKSRFHNCGRMFP